MLTGFVCQDPTEVDAQANFEAHEYLLSDGIECLTSPNNNVNLAMPITDTTIDDQRSFNLIRQGGIMRDQGYTLLYRSYAARFRKFYLYHGVNAADAEDIVQNTFVKILRHCDSYKGDAPLVAWLWKIARNCMIDYFRERGKHPEGSLTEEEWDALLNAMHTFNPPLTGDTLQDCVGKGFAELARKFSGAAYALSLQMEGYDTTYIAAAIQRSPGATREYLSQCRKKIEEFLQPCREYLSAV